MLLVARKWTLTAASQGGPEPGAAAAVARRRRGTVPAAPAHATAPTRTAASRLRIPETGFGSLGTISRVGGPALPRPSLYTATVVDSWPAIAVASAAQPAAIIVRVWLQVGSGASTAASTASTCRHPAPAPATAAGAVAAGGVAAGKLSRRPEDSHIFRTLHS